MKIQDNIHLTLVRGTSEKDTNVLLTTDIEFTGNTAEYVNTDLPPLNHLFRLDVNVKGTEQMGRSNEKKMQ